MTDAIICSHRRGARRPAFESGLNEGLNRWVIKRGAGGLYHHLHRQRGHQ